MIWIRSKHSLPTCTINLLVRIFATHQKLELELKNTLSIIPDIIKSSGQDMAKQLERKYELKIKAMLENEHGLKETIAERFFYIM
jgi:hypothetical protein